MKKIPSIFNDVLSPVTPGPSSSNTCGPHRIASVCRSLLGQPPLSLKIRMAKKGGYFDTFYGMQSDLAFIAGVLGKDFLSYDLSRAYADAEKEGLQTDFSFTDELPEFPSELAEITLYSKTETLTVIGVSLGGGEIEITRLNGRPVSLDAKQHSLIGFLNDGRLEIRCQNQPFSQEELTSLQADPDIRRISCFPPVFPFLVLPGAKPPFTTADELFSAARATGKPFYQLALDYEAALTGEDEQTLLAYGKKLYQLSRDAIASGCRVDSFEGVTAPKAAQYARALSDGRLFSLDFLHRAVLMPCALWSTATLTEKSSACLPAAHRALSLPLSSMPVGNCSFLKRNRSTRCLRPD